VIGVSVLAGDTLVGRWELISWETRLGDQVINPLGDRPQGVLLYTEDGYMSVHAMAPDRPQITSMDPLGGSESERGEAYSGYLAYCGRFEIQGDGAIVHRVELSLFPNWIGAEQVRQVELDADRLVLRTHPVETAQGRAVSELRWARDADPR